jgi:hypothetical protein
MVSDDLYRTVRPMLAVSGGRLVALSTPRGKQGWFHDEWYGSGDWLRVRVPASQCPRIPAEFLADERRALGETWYAQEYEVTFTDAFGEPLFPGAWLNHAERLARDLEGKPRQAVAAGVDPGEGTSATCLCAVDRQGVVELASMLTPDTNVIPGLVIDFYRRHGVAPERVNIDLGGGGQQLVDRLRGAGHNVTGVAFGSSASPPPLRGRMRFDDRVSAVEERYAFCNRRAQMYWELRTLLDPAQGGFAVPARYTELRRQLSPIPLMRDQEGRLRMLPKSKRDPASKERTLTEIIGRSPDDADSLVLACHALLYEDMRPEAGGMW